MGAKATKKHWTEEVGSFQNHVTEELLTALEDRLEAKGLNRRKFAELLGVSEGRVSQIFSDPGNLTLSKMIEWTRKLGLKLSILAYDDDDPDNVLGPVFADVFTGVWEVFEKPRDYEDLARVKQYCSGCSRRGVISAVPTFTSLMENVETPKSWRKEACSIEGMEASTEASRENRTTVVPYQNVVNR